MTEPARPILYVSAEKLAAIRAAFPEMTEEAIKAHFAVEATK